MRSIPIGHIALLVLALSAFAQSARASERFACADGSFVEVTRENRAQQYQHPCVRAWFEKKHGTNRGGELIRDENPNERDNRQRQLEYRAHEANQNMETLVWRRAYEEQQKEWRKKQEEFIRHRPKSASKKP